MQVAEKTEYHPADSLHPTQGSLPCLKLDSQPSLQLLASLSSFASFHMTEPRAYLPYAVPPVDRPRAARCTRAVLVARSACAGLALCFGASTVTLGSELELAVCDTAAPVRLKSNAVDRMTRAEGATRRDDNLMAMSFQIPGRKLPSRRALRFVVLPPSRRWRQVSLDRSF